MTFPNLVPRVLAKSGHYHSHSQLDIWTCKFGSAPILSEFFRVIIDWYISSVFTSCCLWSSEHEIDTAILFRFALMNELNLLNECIQLLLSLPFLWSYNWLKDKLEARDRTAANNNLHKRMNLKFISIVISLKVLSNYFIFNLKHFQFPYNFQQFINFFYNTSCQHYSWRWSITRNKFLTTALR